MEMNDRNHTFIVPLHQLKLESIRLLHVSQSSCGGTGDMGFAQIINFAQKINFLHKKSVFSGNFCAKPEICKPI